MFESSHRSTGGNSANRWLIVAGAGLVILAFVARMLLDIGHTKVSDLAGVLRADTTAAQAEAPEVAAQRPAVAPATVTPDAPTPVATQVVVDTPRSAPVSARRVAGITPPVLKPDTTPRAAAPPKPAPVPAAASNTGYAVQIGAFGSEANAVKLRERAAKAGYAATVIAQPRGGAPLYLVRVQGLGSAEAARQASDSLAHALGVKAVVVPPGR